MSVRPSVIQYNLLNSFLDYSEIRLVHFLHKLSTNSEFREDRPAEGHIY
jgi:hypothetical protein